MKSKPFAFAFLLFFFFFFFYVKAYGTAPFSQFKKLTKWDLFKQTFLFCFILSCDDILHLKESIHVYTTTILYLLPGRKVCTTSTPGFFSIMSSPIKANFHLCYCARKNSAS